MDAPYFWLGTEAEWVALEGHSPMVRIQCAVASHYEIPLLEMRSDRRARAVARPRQVAMFLAKELTLHSLPTIGKHFGNRDHTTVLHAIRVVSKLSKSDPAMARDVRTLREVLA